MRMSEADSSNVVYDTQQVSGERKKVLYSQF